MFWRCRLLLFALSCSICEGALRGLAHGQLWSDGKVDVLFSADKRVLVGLRTAVYSTLESTRQPHRLRLHIAVDKTDAEAFRKAFAFPPDSNVTFPVGASLQLHMLDAKKLQTLYPEVNHLREDGPSNYARFFIDDYLPADSEQAIWLDADVVVQGDVAELADSVMQHPSKTIAFAKYPGSQYGFSGAYSIMSDLTNQSWGKANLEQRVLQHPVWNAGVLGFNMLHMREHRLRKRALHWIQLNADVGLARNGGSQTPLDLAALVHPDEPEDPFIEVDPSWNCWWGFLGKLRTDAELLDCKVIHFAGADKPWNSGPGEHISPAASERWFAAAKRAKDYFA